MKYLSTRNNILRKSFKDILFQGLSDDGGLFIPAEWPKIDINFLKNKSYEDVALEVMYPFAKEDISENSLYEIIKLTYKNFRHTKIAPLINIDKNKFILELFYGPTFAFKDYALQFLGNLFEYYLENLDKKIAILGATSGDTGSAAIEAFRGKRDIKVFILHPLNKVSEVQRRQMTTVTDSNIYNIALDGTFDDCQKIVKDLFLDQEIKRKISLTAINSINWARIMAQSVYFFWAYLQLDNKKINFIVPSGNFGNIYSARVSKHMGLPIDKLHIVTNQNDILHRIISRGQMQINEVKQTFSPSMDIQVSSNFERQLFETLNNDSSKVTEIMNLFFKKGSYSFNNSTVLALQKIYQSESVSNEQTLSTIKLFKEKYNYISDPHTATALQSLNLKKTADPIVSLACAHPAKFGDVIQKAIGTKPILPLEINKIFDKEEKMIILPNKVEEIKSLILKKV